MRADNVSVDDNFLNDQEPYDEDAMSNNDHVLNS